MIPLVFRTRLKPDADIAELEVLGACMAVAQRLSGKSGSPLS